MSLLSWNISYYYTLKHVKSFSFIFFYIVIVSCQAVAIMINDSGLWHVVNVSLSHSLAIYFPSLSLSHTHILSDVCIFFCCVESNLFMLSICFFSFYVIYFSLLFFRHIQILYFCLFADKLSCKKNEIPSNSNVTCEMTMKGNHVRVMISVLCCELMVWRKGVMQ